MVLCGSCGVRGVRGVCVFWFWMRREKREKRESSREREKYRSAHVHSYPHPSPLYRYSRLFAACLLASSLVNIASYLILVVVAPSPHLSLLVEVLSWAFDAASQFSVLLLFRSAAARLVASSKPARRPRRRNRTRKKINPNYQTPRRKPASEQGRTTPSGSAIPPIVSGSHTIINVRASDSCITPSSMVRPLCTSGSHTIINVRVDAKFALRVMPASPFLTKPSFCLMDLDLALASHAVMTGVGLKIRSGISGKDLNYNCSMIYDTYINIE